MKKTNVIWMLQLGSLALLMISFFFQVNAAMIAGVILLLVCFALNFYWNSRR